jgi:hypothetical protein
VAPALHHDAGVNTPSTFPTIPTTTLSGVIGGAASKSTMPSSPRVCTTGNPSGAAKQQSLTNPTPGAKQYEATGKSIEKYGKFYENYTGLIDNLNGIGGGGAVARGGDPKASGF